MQDYSDTAAWVARFTSEPEELLNAIQAWHEYVFVITGGVRELAHITLM